MATIQFDDEPLFTIGTGYTASSLRPGQSGVLGKHIAGMQMDSGMPKIVTGTFTFDSSYPTGGEDISEVFNQFTSLKGIVVERGVTLANSKTGKNVVIDYSNKTAMLYTNATTPAQVGASSDQANSTFRFLAWGR